MSQNAMSTSRFSNMPQGTLAIFFIQMVSTLSFSVLYSTLVLYMKDQLAMPMSTANSIMGVFIAFNYGLHLLGGFLGGRFLSYRALFSVGMAALVVGCVLLSFGSVEYLYYGLAAFLTGAGLNVTCLNCMLTQLFTTDDPRRETAFLWNYASMNVGFFVGFSMSGVFQLSHNYGTLFLFGSVGNLMALVICMLFWKQLADRNTSFSTSSKAAQKQSTWLGLGMVALMPFALSQLLQSAGWATRLVLVTGAVMMATILYLAKQQDSEQARNKMYAFAVFMVVSTIFWMLYQICPMGLTHFIDHNVTRHYDGWTIPPQWFQNVNTVSVVIGGPLLGYMLNRLRQNGVKVNIPAQFALALLFIGLAFAILPIGIMVADAQGFVSPSWIVACFVLQSIGELLISPIGYAMIGYLAPAPLQGVMMGMWMLNSGVGATLSSYSSNMMITSESVTTPVLTNPGYSHVFLILGLISIGASVVLATLVPWLNRLMHTNPKSESMVSEASCMKEQTA